MQVVSQIVYSSARVSALVRAGSKQKMVLNSSDKLFAELRDMDFPTAAARVNRDLKRLKDGYDRSKARAVSWNTNTYQLCSFIMSAAVTSARRGHLHGEHAHPKPCVVCVCRTRARRCHRSKTSQAS